MERKEYLGITAAQAKEIKNAVSILTNPQKLTIFDVMTPENYEWINKEIDTAIRAASFRKEKFFKLWLVHHFKFQPKVFFFSHLFLPALTKKLMKYRWPECHGEKRNFRDLDMVNCTISNLIDENLIDQTIKESATGCYRDYFK